MLCGLLLQSVQGMQAKIWIAPMHQFHGTEQIQLTKFHSASVRPVLSTNYYQKSKVIGQHK